MRAQKVKLFQNEGNSAADMTADQPSNLSRPHLVFIENMIHQIEGNKSNIGAKKSFYINFYFSGHALAVYC